VTVGYGLENAAANPLREFDRAFLVAGWAEMASLT